MSHFGRAGPPDIRDTYSLLVLNITFRTSADDLFPLFDRYGKVVDIFIPRDRRTGESRGFAFVRYKHAAEAQKAIERLDGRNVDGRDIVVQYAKYGRNDEAIHRGKITQGSPKWRSRSRSRSPKRSRILNSRGCRENVSVSQTFPPSPGRGRNQEQSAAHQSHRYRDDCYERVFRRRSRSRSRDWHDRHHHRRMEVYRRGSPSGSQGSISRSNSQSLSTSDLRELRPSGSAVGKPLSVMGDSLTQALSLTRECQGSLSPTRSSLHSRTPPHGAMQEPRNGNPSIVEVMSSDHDGDRALAAGRSSPPARGHHPPDRCPLPPDPHGLSPHP